MMIAVSSSSSRAPIGPLQPDGRLVEAAFFARPSDAVAPDLLGKILWRGGVGGGRLTEVEAYLPESDPACHAYRGRTARNAAMFGLPGTIYVFRSYGIHFLLNLVCEGEGVGAAVLIRSFEPVGETSLLERNRSDNRRLARRYGHPCVDSRVRLDLSCGPGRVGQALGVDLSLNGTSIGEDSGFVLIDDGWRAEVGCSTRIGISRGEKLLLRYFAADTIYTSGSRRMRREDA